MGHDDPPFGQGDDSFRVRPSEAVDDLAYLSGNSLSYVGCVQRAAPIDGTGIQTSRDAAKC
jgi:hypothetical protein